MGILSSILGDRPSTPQTGGFTVGAEIPDELKPFYKDILGKSQALYNESVSRGFEPYTGPSLAEFTPEQQQAFTGLAGLQGGTAPVFQEAMQMTRDAAAPITTEQIEEYMNPYQQAVVDIEKREAQKQFESQVVPQLAAKAAMAQPFGGSRQAILEGMAADTQQRLLGDIQAKGSAQAYQDAVNLINNQRTASGQAAGQLATMAPNQFKTQLAEFGALQGVGEEKQKLAQQALNEAYGQYLKEQEYPYQQLGRYQSVVTGAPISTREYVPPVEQPSATNQLLGGLGTLASTYGAFGGFSPGGFMGMNKPAKTGGGIKDLPVIKRQSEGLVYEGDPEFGLGVNTLTNPQLIALEEKRRIQEAINAQRNKNFFSNIKNIFTSDKNNTTKNNKNNLETYNFPFGSLGQNKETPKAGKYSVTQILKDIDKDPELQTKKVKKYTPERNELSDIDFISNLPTDPVLRQARINSPRYKKIMDNMSGMIDPPAPKGSEVTDEGISAVLNEMKEKQKPASKSVEELQEESDRLTKEQQEKKDKKDPVKTDETDVYADARAAEDAYLEALSGKEKRIQGNLDKLGIQEREAQFGNLAMLFSRLGTKSGSVLSALVESTGEVLPAALKTKNEFAKEERRLKTAIEDAQIGSLKTKADIKKSRAKLKTTAAKSTFDMAMEERRVQADELKAKAAAWKAKHPDIKMPSDPNKDDKTNAGLLVRSVYDSADPNDRASIDSLIRSNSKSRSPEELTNFINKLSKDETAQFYIAGELERAKVVAEKEGRVLTREEQKEIVGRTIVNLIETNSAINEKADDSWGYRIIPDWLF
jgi:hypothetical protein